jgi:tetratricopeptide (TPR) repeat protein
MDQGGFSMTISRAALAFSLALGAAAAPALAQLPSRSGAPAPRPHAPTPAAAPAAGQPGQPGRQYNLSRGETDAFNPVIAAVNAQDWPTAQTALDAATPAAHGPGAKYLAGQLRLRMGIGTNNVAMQSQAIDEMIASGGAQPDELRPLYENQFDFAILAGDTAKAERAMAQLRTISPNDPELFVRVARVKVGANDPAGAIAAYQQAVQAQQAAGRPIPVEWRQQMAGIAYRGHLPQTMSLMHDWLVAAPSPAIWHDTLAIYGETHSADNALKLDVYRLIRAAGAMTAERDFITLSEAAGEVRAIGEVKAVLDEGLGRNLITANAAYARERLSAINPRVEQDRASLVNERRTALAGSDGVAALRVADSLYGYGQYAEAAELYRAALTKGGVDANLANTRLGEALAMAGQRTQAEAAFHAVTGPRAELAQYWLLWLSSRPA